MVWFLERESELLICEIRREGDQYAFEMAPSQGPVRTKQYSSPRELIDQYLSAIGTLKAEGWRPKADTDALS